MALTQKDILTAKAFRRVYEEKTYAIGDDTVTIRLRSLNEPERTRYELSLQDKKGKVSIEKARRCLIVLCVVDEEGNQVWNDESELLEMDGGLAGRIYSDVNRLCGFNDKEVEELVKNSEEAAG